MHMHTCYYSQQLTGKKAKVSNVKQQQNKKIKKNRILQSRISK